MRNSCIASLMTALLVLSAASTLSVSPAHAATFQTLYAFKHSCCGTPSGRLHFLNGNLYGTGFGQGGGSHGQVFELVNSGGAWVETSPIIFNGTDGGEPTAGLISDSFGVLFGTTTTGGVYNKGTVFSLTNSGGTWTLSTLWPFGGTSGDGYGPDCDLVMDSSGNLYGTTYHGGASGYGTVFEITTLGSENILYSFAGGSDGANPYAGLLRDSSGALYGTTLQGGNKDGCPGRCGTVFELTQTGGVWTEKILHRFNLSDGWVPAGALIMDSTGALYGTTEFGGSEGNVFKLYQSGGVWKEKVLYAFPADQSQGAFPRGALRWNGSNVLYGTTLSGGASGGGTVFELKLSGGVWTHTDLYDFGGGSDGAYPQDQVVLDKSGNLYGTASTGGAYNYGTVWELTP